MSRYLEPLFRHWIQFVALLLVIPVALVAGNLAFLRTHQASAQLWVDNPSYLGTAASPPDWSQYLSPAQNETDSLTQALKTQSFKDSVADSLVASGAITTRKQRGEVVGSMRSALRVTASGTHLVSLTYSCDRAALCLGVVTATIDQYRQQLADSQRNQAAVAEAFYTTQLATAQTNLTTAQAALSTYLVEHPGAGLTDPTGTADKLQRDVTTSRAIISSLSDKLTQTQLTAAASKKVVDTVSRIADAPAIDGGNILGAPETKRALLESGVSWLVAIAYLALLAWLDRTVRDPQDLERKVQVPVLATIPHFADMGSV